MIHGKVIHVAKKEGDDFSLVVRTGSGQTFRVGSRGFREPFKANDEFGNRFGLLEKPTNIIGIPEREEAVLIEPGDIEERGRRWTTLALWAPLQKEYNSEILRQSEFLEEMNHEAQSSNWEKWNSPQAVVERQRMLHETVNKELARLNGGGTERMGSL